MGNENIHLLHQHHDIVIVTLFISLSEITEIGAMVFF